MARMSDLSRDRRVGMAIGGVSAVAFAFLFWLIYFNENRSIDPETVAFLPTVNATLNGLSAVCLALGLMAIKRRDRALHQKFMVSALAFSGLFLVSYIIYHAVHGDTKFVAEGLIRPIYFFVLVSHIGLSMVAFPLVLTTFWLSWTGQLARHRRMAKFTFPLWMYVSVTGVAIVVMLKVFNP